IKNKKYSVNMGLVILFILTSCCLGFLGSFSLRSNVIDAMLWSSQNKGVLRTTTSESMVALENEEVQEPEYVPGEIMVKFKSTVKFSNNLSNEIKKQNNFIMEGVAITKVSGIPSKIKNLIKSDKNDKTTLEPLFRGLYQRMKKEDKSEQDISREMVVKFSERSKLSVKDLKNYSFSNIYILKNVKNNNKGKVIDGIADKGMEDIAKDLANDPNIEYAEPNQIVRTTFIPNDPYYSSKGAWGQSYDDLYGLKKDKMNVEEAWDKSKGEGILVAVIDTGVDYNHEDIKDNVWINQGEDVNHNGIVDEGDFNKIDDDGNGYIDDVRGWDFVNHDNDPKDGYGHGTHCAGTIAAAGDNNLGIIGVASKAKIMVIKGLSDSGSGTTIDLANAIYYAVDNGANILSNSWGGAGSSQIYEAVFQYAEDNGALAIAAAGNGYSDAANFTPANVSSVLAVAAIGHDNLKASFSNWGDTVGIAAPGVNILSLDPYAQLA
ncbi:MAG: S8 family peptidase, partial [bacterium]